MRLAHHVHERQVLDVRPRADADGVHVAADDDVHPDAALGADVDVADDLGADVDERGRDRTVGMNGPDTGEARG